MEREHSVKSEVVQPSYRWTIQWELSQGDLGCVQMTALWHSSSKSFCEASIYNGGYWSDVTQRTGRMKFLFKKLPLDMRRNSHLKQQLYLIPPQMPRDYSPPPPLPTSILSNLLPWNPPSILTHQDIWVIQWSSNSLKMHSFACH